MITNQIRKQLYLNCLNHNFKDVFKTVKKLPPMEIDKNVLELWLRESCLAKDAFSVQYIWYRYMMRQQINMYIKPSMLYKMSQLGIENNQKFISGHIYEYFNKYYSNDTKFKNWQLKLLILKLDSQMKFSQLPFIIKWKLVYRDLRNVKFQDQTLHITDFPNLVKSYDKTVNIDVFLRHSTQGNVNYKKNQSLKILFLNCILLQESVSPSKKMFIFEQILKKNPKVQYDDSIKILKELFNNDPHRLDQLEKLISLSSINSG